MKKLCRIVALDPAGQVAMDLFASLSERQIAKAEELLSEMTLQGLLRGYQAGPFQERRQLHIQALLWPALQSELDDLRRLMMRPGMSGKRLYGPKDWSPIDPITEHIADEIARALFVTAWADAREEAGDSFSGQNLYDVAPETPEYVFRDAMDFVRKMERLNKMPMREMYQTVLDRAGLHDSPYIRDEFGFTTAMQAMGTGVRWTDDRKPHGLKVPYIEFSKYNLKDEDLGPS